MMEDKKEFDIDKANKKRKRLTGGLLGIEIVEYLIVSSIASNMSATIPIRSFWVFLFTIYLVICAYTGRRWGAIAQLFVWFFSIFELILLYGYLGYNSHWDHIVVITTVLIVVKGILYFYLILNPEISYSFEITKIDIVRRKLAEME
jgi:hypothetical protein